jgi:hypothetical protein
MNGILDDALSGLLLLREEIDSDNDSEDHCTTQSSNDSSTTPPSNDSNATHTFDNSSATPTSSLPKKKWKYMKRGWTSFAQKKGTNKAKYICKATLKPRAAKMNANIAITKVVLDNASSNGYVMKLDEENVRKLVSLFYIKIGAPPPDELHGRGGTISKTMNALDMSVLADECRKVERIITKTYHSLLGGEEYNEGRKSRKNLTAIADGNKIQQLVADYREAGLSFSQTTVMIN